MPKKKSVISDKSINDFGNIQQQIGEATSDLNLYRSYILLTFLSIIGLSLIIYGFTVSVESGKWAYIIAGVILIVIGIISVLYNRFMNKIVHKNKGAAQLYAVREEISMIKNALEPPTTNQVNRPRYRHGKKFSTTKIK